VGLEPKRGAATAFRLWAGVCTILAAMSVGTARADFSCPDQLDVQQRAAPPHGWAVNYSEVPPRLSGVTLFDGQPSNKVALKYDQRKSTARELILMWTLRETPRSHYVQCSYERTTAQIAAPLPPGTTSCEVVFDRTAAYPSGALPVKRMVCR
jgi:hypothetical protein